MAEFIGSKVSAVAEFFLLKIRENNAYLLENYTQK